MITINILSLFDGMACGMLAMQSTEIEVGSYDAFEIDKYAVKTAQHNFPNIQEHGDVFKANFTQYAGVDFLIGGSPCTYWSIAQSPDKRETTASGMGWKLFSQYVRALHEAKPKYFIYENNKSMSSAIRDSISETFGFEPICINSALVSAQNRQRLYWVGKRNFDDTYNKVAVNQPDDRGETLQSILESGIAIRGKAPCIDANYYKGGQSNLSVINQVSDYCVRKEFLTMVSIINLVQYVGVMQSREKIKLRKIVSPITHRNNSMITLLNLLIHNRIQKYMKLSIIL